MGTCSYTLCEDEKVVHDLFSTSLCSNEGVEVAASVGSTCAVDCTGVLNRPSGSDEASLACMMVVGSAIFVSGPSGETVVSKGTCVCGDEVPTAVATTTQPTPEAVPEPTE